MLYYLLRAYDEDFSKLFKVRAEFATSMERNPETEYEYGLFVKSVVVDNHLPPFDRDAVARIIEYSARLAEDQNRLSTRFGKIADLVREAAYWARKDAAKGDGEPVLVSRESVQHAIEENIFRSDLIEERIQEMIAKGTILITLTGKAVGQINALSVISLGDYAFGRPSRVTAIAHPGRQGIVDIERVAKLGGPIHTKGVLILSGLLGQRYGQEQPLSLTASLAFEQSYEGIEGDSASAAEFFLLLSAISGVPLRQDLAITGSINQHGQIQAIGGVNEKIEGFFYTCRQGGLTGEQGVIIPASNIPHLMLSEQVAEAVSSGQFHIWAIQSIDEGIALLTGIDPGERQPDGAYPEGSVNFMVMERLMGYAKSVALFSGNGEPRPGENRTQPSHTPDNDH
jgi:predicted ATP-dependent protease